MATGDFADLYQAAMRLARRPSTDSTSVTIAKAHVNECASAVQVMEWDEPRTGRKMHFDYAEQASTFSTAIGTATYTFTTVGTGSVNVNDVLWVGPPTSGTTSTSPLPRFVPYDDFMQAKAMHGATGNGTPELWTKYARTTVELLPVPDAVRVHSALVILRPAEMVLDADVTSMPVIYRRNIITHYAAWKLLEEEYGQPTRETEGYKQRYLEALEELKAAHGVASPPQPAHTSLAFVSESANFAFGTVGGLALAVVRETGGKEWDSFALRRAKDAISEAYITVLTASDDWKFLRREGTATITAGTSTITYDALATALGLTGDTVEEVIELIDDTGASMLERTSTEGLEWMTQSTQYMPPTGSAPTYWTVSQNRAIRFWPQFSRASSLRVIYRLRPQALAGLADSSSTAFPTPTWANRVLVPYAAHLLLTRPNPSSPGDVRLGSQERLTLATSMWDRYQMALADFRGAYGTANEPVLGLHEPAAFMDLPDFGLFGGIR